MKDIYLLGIVVAGIVANFIIPLEAPGVLPVLLVVGVLLGIPHGSFDAITSTRDGSGRRYGLSVILLYLVAGGLVLIGWIFSPVITIPLFFLLSAFHFGSEEDIPTDLKGRPLYTMAIGGFLIWCTVVFQADRVSEILTLLTPGLSNAAFQLLLNMLALISYAMLLIVGLALFESFQLSGDENGSRSFQIRMLLFGLLFCTTDPIIAFFVYFSLWHSLKGFHAEYERFQEQRTALQIVGLASAVTIAIAFGAYFLLDPLSSVPTRLIQIAFIGLSVIAVPHILKNDLGLLGEGDDHLSEGAIS